MVPVIAQVPKVFYQKILQHQLLQLQQQHRISERKKVCIEKQKK